MSEQFSKQQREMGGMWKADTGAGRSESWKFQLDMWTAVKRVTLEVLEGAGVITAGPRSLAWVGRSQPATQAGWTGRLVGTCDRQGDSEAGAPTSGHCRRPKDYPLIHTLCWKDTEFPRFWKGDWSPQFTRTPKVPSMPAALPWESLCLPHRGKEPLLLALLTISWRSWHFHREGRNKKELNMDNVKNSQSKFKKWVQNADFLYCLPLLGQWRHGVMFRVAVQMVWFKQQPPTMDSVEPTLQLLAPPFLWQVSECGLGVRWLSS